MTGKVFIGIDPGKTGAIAIIPVGLDSGIKIRDYAGPEDIDRVFSFVDFVTYAGIEDVNQYRMPNKGRYGVQWLIKTASYWKMAMICHGIPYVEVPPKEWQSEMIPPHCRNKHTKKAAIAAVHYHYPEMKKKIWRISKDHNRADALLMAGYAKRLNDLRERRR